jgi:hypothetical protein
MKMNYGLNDPNSEFYIADQKERIRKAALLQRLAILLDTTVEEILENLK